MQLFLSPNKTATTQMVAQNFKDAKVCGEILDDIMITEKEEVDDETTAVPARCSDPAPVLPIASAQPQGYSEDVPARHNECSRKHEEKNSNISSILVLLLMIMISRQTNIIERMNSVEQQKISPYKIFINLFYASKDKFLQWIHRGLKQAIISLEMWMNDPCCSSERKK